MRTNWKGYFVYLLIIVTLFALMKVVEVWGETPSPSPTGLPLEGDRIDNDEVLPTFEIPVEVPPGFLPVKLKVKNPSVGTFTGSDGSQTPAPAASKNAPPIAEQRHDKVTGANLDAPNYVADQQKKAAAQSHAPTPTPTPTMATKVVVKDVQKESDLPKVLEALKANGAYQVGYYQACAGGPIQVKALYKVPESEKLTPAPTPTVVATQKVVTTTTTTVTTEPALVPNNGLLALIIGVCAVIFFLSVAWVLANR